MKQEVLPRKGADRDAKGHWLKGHARSSPGRPKGALNVVTKSLRESVLEGLGDVPAFVKTLKADYPPAAAGLLAKLMPPSDAEDAAQGGGVTVINILPIRSGTFVLPDGFDGPVPRHLKLVVNDAPIDHEPPKPA